MNQTMDDRIADYVTDTIAALAAENPAKKPSKSRISNEVIHLPGGVTELTIIRRDGSRHPFLLDSCVYAGIAHLNLYTVCQNFRGKVKKYYAYLKTADGKSMSLHRYLLSHWASEQRPQLHHVHGHSDNRMDALQPVSRKEHAKLHAAENAANKKLKDAQKQP